MSQDSLPKIPALRSLKGKLKGKQFRLLARRILIGTSETCDIVLKNQVKCSAEHALLKKVQDQYSIESVDPKNPVLVNGKPISAHTLKQNDVVVLGGMELRYIENSAIQARYQQATGTKAKPNLSKILLAVACLGLFVIMLTDQDDTSLPTSQVEVRTEKDMEKELEAIKKLQQAEEKEQAATPRGKEARAAFLRGFRDYHKGYYNRALRAFEHCLTLNKKNKICHSYSRKSQARIDGIIQKKMLLGKNYIDNLQFQACAATFRSIEIMLGNQENPIHKEALERRRFCELKSSNKL